MQKIDPIEKDSISPATARALLIAFLLVGLALRVSTTLAIPGALNPDEIFQTQEPAHRLAYGYGVISWEWTTGIRSWVFPAFLAGVMRATAWMGAAGRGYLLGIPLVLSLLSLTTVWFCYAWGKRAGGVEAALIAAGTCAIWYTMVMYGSRALTEVVATNALLPGLYLGLYGEKLNERRRMLLVGAFCGLAMCLRIQLAPAVAFAAAYFCFEGGAWKRRIVPLSLGLLAPVVFFGGVDAVTWSYPFESFVRYVQVNLIHGHGALFDTEPWYWYIGVTLPAQLGPLLIIAFWGVRRSRFLASVALVILISHNVIPHKEDRFLYPMLPLVITLAALGTVQLAQAWNKRRPRPLSSKAIVAAGLALPSPSRS